MAIYCTFFLCEAQELASGFPGWLPPLPQPVRREIRNPFTRQISIIETRKPEWPRDDPSSNFAVGYKATAIQGRYEDYLEGRLQPFVRDKPHWCAKGLTEIELTPLGEACGLRSFLEPALYNRPSSGASLQRFHEELISKLIHLDDNAIIGVAKSWATRMSAPEFTHSVTGRKLSDGWTNHHAMEILQPIIALAKRGEPGTSMYLLIEA